MLRILRPEARKYLFRRDHAYAVVKDIVIISLLWELLLEEATFSFWWIFVTDLPDTRGGTPRNRKHTLPQEHEIFGKLLMHAWRHNSVLHCIVSSPSQLPLQRNLG